MDKKSTKTQSATAKGFLLYKDFQTQIDGLDNEQAGLLFKAIFAYQNDLVFEVKDPVVKFALIYFTSKFEKDKKTDRRGEFHWNWKGGITPKNHAIRQSTEYKDWRKAVYKRDEYECVECGKTGNLEAHHIKPFSKYPDLRMDIDNGITLCPKCHKQIHKQMRLK